MGMRSRALGSSRRWSRANVDTDQIIPKQFLSQSSEQVSTSFSSRSLAVPDDGSANPSFEMNEPSTRRHRYCCARPISAADPARQRRGHCRLRLSRSARPASPTSSITIASTTACCRSWLRPPRSTTCSGACALPKATRSTSIWLRRRSRRPTARRSVRHRPVPEGAPAQRLGPDRSYAAAPGKDRRLRAAPWDRAVRAGPATRAPLPSARAPLPPLRVERKSPFAPRPAKKRLASPSYAGSCVWRSWRVSHYRHGSGSPRATFRWLLPCASRRPCPSRSTSSCSRRSPSRSARRRGHTSARRLWPCSARAHCWPCRIKTAGSRGPTNTPRFWPRSQCSRRSTRGARSTPAER